MPTGVIIRDKQGNIQKVPFDQLQQVDPLLYAKYTQNVAQPQAQLQETQAAAGAAGASAELSSQETVNAQLRQKIEQAAVDQLDIINKAGDYFESSKGHGRDGYVSPDDYNSYLDQYAQKGGDPNLFHRNFAQRVNPNNIWYNTPDNINTRGNLSTITNILKSYQLLPQEQVGPQAREIAGYIAKIPVVGGKMAQNYLYAANAHDAMINSQAANIKNIITQQSQQQGSSYPLRNLIELSNMVNILPTSDMDTKTAEAKITELDNLLQARFGLNGTKDLYQLFPGGNQ